MITDEEVQAAIDKLDSLNGRNKTKWERIPTTRPGYNSRGSFYDENNKIICLGLKARIDDVVHEYAHVVFDSRYRCLLSFQAEGGPHGARFIAILEEVVTKFYGDAKLYPNWDDEYPHITGYAFAKGYINTPITKRLRNTEFS